jgi:hypothetical protein
MVDLAKFISEPTEIPHASRSAGPEADSCGYPSRIVFDCDFDEAMVVSLGSLRGDGLQYLE